MESTNNVKIKIDERVSLLANKLSAIKHRNCLWSPDVKNALDNMHKAFVLVSIYKSLLFLKGFMPLL